MADEVTETKVTEFEDGSKIVETVTTASEYIQPDESREAEAEIMEAIEAEAVEEVTDAAVEIARIEAERDITIAAINAETTTAAIEAQAESEEETSWQQSIESRQDRMEADLAEIKAALLTPPPSQEAPPNPQTDPASESPEVTPESHAEERAPEPPKRAPKRRWI